MQQRFCTCGHVIWVEYLFPNLDPKIVFRSKNQSTSDSLNLCPLCKKNLEIDDLG